MDDIIRLGRFTIIFDDEGCTITTSTSKAQYRVNGTLATNAVNFMKHYRSLIFAMTNERSEELTAYKIAELGTQ